MTVQERIKTCLLLEKMRDYEGLENRQLKVASEFKEVEERRDIIESNSNNTLDNRQGGVFYGKKEC